MISNFKVESGFIEDFFSLFIIIERVESDIIIEVFFDIFVKT